MPARTVASQLDAIFDDVKIDAVKTGMIYLPRLPMWWLGN